MFTTLIRLFCDREYEEAKYKGKCYVYANFTMIHIVDHHLINISHYSLLSKARQLYNDLIMLTLGKW